MIAQTHDSRIVSRIHAVLKDAVAHETDANLLSAYACWHVTCGQDWSQFYRCITPALRAEAYAAR